MTPAPAGRSTSGPRRPARGRGDPGLRAGRRAPPTARRTATNRGHHGYQSIHTLQLGTVGASFGNEFRARARDGGAPDGELVDVDYAGTARALGCRAWRADTPEALNARAVPA